MILRPCFALLGLSWLTVAVHGLHFYLKGDEEKCFLEELASDTLVEGHYKAVQWSEPDQDWKINPEMGIQVVVEEVSTGDTVANVHGQPEGKFTFTSHEPGDHSICLRSNTSSGFFSTTHIKFYLDITVGSAKKDTTQDTTHITTLASKLRELNDKVNSIKLEQQYQREVEATFRDASEKTNSRAVWWILAQMVVLGGMALWQNRHLKTYFGDKKVR